MAIEVRVHSNEDDALISWRPDPWPKKWVGFSIEKRDGDTGEVTTLTNRIPARAGGGEVPEGGISSALSPIRRCLWTDHGVGEADSVSYRVTALEEKPAGVFTPAAASASGWTAPVVASAGAGDGLWAFFNRGTIMSQVVSRFVSEEIGISSLKRFKTHLADPGFPARRYLSGYARHEILDFLADADRPGNEVYAALYELNDQELIDALKAFGGRGNVLLGNGSAIKYGVVDELEAANLHVEERDLSHGVGSSPSVHNKFVVERDPRTGKALRALTGSTNWTTTGLCTQLNNVLVIERPRIAERFLKEWRALAAAGDDLPDALKSANADPTIDGPVKLYFAATPHKEELREVEELIRGAKEGIFFLMFTPGESPILHALLDRSQGAEGPYVRGVVSEVRETKNGTIKAHNARVIRTGEEKKFRDSTLLPDGTPGDNLPSWAREEFLRRMFFPAGLNAIVHSKVVVVDPFSDTCAVVTGSHNFSVSASRKNDENLVIVRGNRALAQAYAVHIQGVYDHYSWRAFLAGGGNPDTLYQSLAGWKPGGSRARDLAFWMR